MSHIVKVDGWDIGVKAGPVAARSVQFSGILQGGHAAASWETPVDSAYLRPHHVLRPGKWVVIYDDEHELWEGEIRSVRPVVSVSGEHKLQVTGAGLMSRAAKRKDSSKTWVHRGASDWVLHPDANRSGEYTNGSDGYLKMLIRQGAKEMYTPAMMLIYYLDNMLSDDTVSYIDYTADWDVTDESTYGFAWSLTSGTETVSESDTSSDGTDGHLPAATPAVSWVAASLWGYDSSGTRTLSGDKYVQFTKIDVYGSSLTAKVRVDEAMVDVATRTGLAVSSDFAAVGKPLDDLHVERTSAAATLEALAQLHASPLEYGFWDEKCFRGGPIPRRPASPHHVVVVGGGLPGLESWDITRDDSDRPDAVAVYFKNQSNASYPEGMVRRLVVPRDPGDTADAVVEVVDYSSLILSDAAATTIGMQLLGEEGTSYELPSGLVFSAHPEFADSGVSAGNNDDPTSSYAQTEADWTAGTVSGAAWTTSSGWAGSNSPLDPTCLECDGTDTKVDFGDLAACSFGIGAFTVSCWFRLDATGKAQALIGKVDTGADPVGYALTVTLADHLLGYLRLDATHVYYVCHGETLVADTWYYAAMTWGGAAAQPKLYLDGQEDEARETHSVTVPGSASNAYSLIMGAQS